CRRGGRRALVRRAPSSRHELGDRRDEPDDGHGLLLRDDDRRAPRRRPRDPEPRALRGRVSQGRRRMADREARDRHGHGQFGARRGDRVVLIRAARYEAFRISIAAQQRGDTRYLDSRCRTASGRLHNLGPKLAVRRAPAKRSRRSIDRSPMMRITRYSSSAVLALALQSLLLASNATAQEAQLPMGRTIGDACTRSVSLPAPAPGPMRGPGPAGGPPAGGPGPGGFPALAAPAGPEEPTRLERVADDVYAIINANDAVMPDIPLYGGNVAVYLTDDGVVLVDAKTDGMHDDLVAKVQSLTDQPIKYVVLTHHHPDHSGGAARLQALGATVIVSAANRERMVASGRPGPQMGYEGRAQIVLGGKRIELLEFCGH